MSIIRRQFVTAFVCAGAVFFAGCATTPGQPASTESKTGAALGAVGGAALGLLAAALTGNSKNTAGYMAAGAVAGGTAGALYGASVARKKAMYRTEEEYIAACRVQAIKSREAANAQAEQLGRELAQIENESRVIAELKRSSSQPTTAAVAVEATPNDRVVQKTRTVLASIDGREKVATAAQQAVEKELVEQRFALTQVDRKQPSAAQLESEISRLDSERGRLDYQVVQLRALQKKATYRTEEEYIAAYRDEAIKSREAANAQAEQIGGEIAQIENESRVIAELKRSSGQPTTVAVAVEATPNDQVVQKTRTVLANIDTKEKAATAAQQAVEKVLVEQRYALTQLDRSQPGAAELESEVSRLDSERGRLADQVAQLHALRTNLTQI